MLEARTAVEVLEEELLRVACPELLLLTEPSEEELLLLTVVPEALLLERVLEALDPLLEERVLPVDAALLLEEERVTCWLLLPEVLLVVVEEPEEERVACWFALLPEEERVTCWLLLPEVLLVEEEPEVERLTCWLPEELDRETEEPEPELERVAWVEDDLVPLLERVWAIISGAVTRDRAISTVAAIVIKRLIASNF